MNFNYSIQVNGELNLDLNASDSTDKITTRFPQLKKKEADIKLQLETFKNSNKIEDYIEGILIVKIEIIEQIISQSEKENENLNTTENEPNHKTENELLHERLSQKHAPRRIPQTKNKSIKLKIKNYFQLFFKIFRYYILS